MVLAREPLVVYNPEPGAYKTSIVFSMQEGPGQLYKVSTVAADVQDYYVTSEIAQSCEAIVV